MNPAIATALTNPGAPMKVRSVQKRFGAFTALDNVSLAARRYVDAGVVKLAA